MSYESVPRWIREIPEHFKTQEMCNEAVCNNPAVFLLVPDCFKTEEMCDKALEGGPWSLYGIPDNIKTQEMCNKAVEDDSSSFQFAPDRFVTQEQLDIWFDDDYWYHNDEIIEWYKGYQKRKAQKAKIKEELLPITWHPDRVMDWCMSEDYKRPWK